MTVLPFCCLTYFFYTVTVGEYIIDASKMLNIYPIVFFFQCCDINIELFSTASSKVIAFNLLCFIFSICYFLFFLLLKVIVESFLFLAVAVKSDNYRESNREINILIWNQKLFRILEAPTIFFRTIKYLIF